MSGTRLAALVLIIAGILGLAYGGFTYTKDTHQADIGPIELSVEEKETVNIPVWLGAGALIAGVLLLVMRGKKGP
jgi:drug/metabolite transporter (DMT)-like permease